jgi:hypothetical protein
MLYTTFRIAKDNNACVESYRKMAKELGGVRKYGKDTPIELDKVLEVCGLQDALWCLRATTVNCDKESRLLACDYAEHVLPIYEKKYPNDNRPRQAVEVSRRYANGEATSIELSTARDAARAARDAASADTDAARVASAAAWVAASADTDAARVASDAAWAAAIDAAIATRNSEIIWQTEKFKEMLK